jgi:hypothetical protein
MKTKGSLPCSQQPASEPRREPHTSRHTLLLCFCSYGQFNNKLLLFYALILKQWNANQPRQPLNWRNTDLYLLGTSTERSIVEETW